MTTTAGPAIQTIGLRKEYPRGRQQKPFVAVDDVSFEVPAGQVFGLLGPNGAGKTTVFKMISGLLTPSSGDVLIHGVSIRRRRSQAVSLLGTLLEGRRNLYWPLTVQENLEYFGALKCMAPRSIKSRLATVGDALGLTPFLKKPVGQLSTGWQQRVSLAAALISDAPVLLLDEPTLGLDPESTVLMRGLVRSLAEESGKTVFLTTHDLHLAGQVCHTFLILRAGQIHRHFSRELLDRFSEAITFLLDCEGQEGAALLRAQTVPGVLEATVIEDENHHPRLRLIMRNPQVLADVLVALRHCVNVRDVVRQPVTLEEIFLTATRERQLQVQGECVS